MPNGIDNKIKKLIDLYFSNRNRLDLMKHPVVPKEMVAGHEDAEGWTPWKAVPSKISIHDISELEKEIGYSLPKLFKDLLCYKSYLKLDFDSVRFPSLPSDKGIFAARKWLVDLSEQFNLLERGFIIFASSTNDESFYCFLAPKYDETINLDCPVFLFDPGGRGSKLINAFPLFSSMVDALLEELGSKVL
jgi:hypothetical protein